MFVGERPTKWELDVIARLDTCALRHFRDTSKDAAKSHERKVIVPSPSSKR